MVYQYRRKIFILLTFILILLTIIFITSLLNPQFVFFNLGLPNPIQNHIIALFSFLCIGLIVWDLRRL